MYINSHLAPVQHNVVAMVEMQNEQQIVVNTMIHFDLAFVVAFIFLYCAGHTKFKEIFDDFHEIFT